MAKYQPALLGGLFIGVLSSLPVISACCCLWVIAGGVLVVYLQQQNSPLPVATSDAALHGLLAGAIGGLIAVGVQAAMTSVFGPMALEEIRTQMSSNNDIPPEMRDTLLRLLTGRNLVLIQFLVAVPMYAVFSMAGAFLGLAFFRKKLPPTPQV